MDDQYPYSVTLNDSVGIIRLTLRRSMIKKLRT